MPHPPDKDLLALRDIPDPLPPRRSPASRPPDSGVVAEGPSPKREDIALRRKAAVLASATWMALLLATLGLRRDLAQLPVSLVVGHIGLWMVLAVLALWASLKSGPVGLGVGARPLLIVTIALPMAFVVGSLRGSGAISLVFADAQLVPCVLKVSLFAAGPLVFSALVLRRAFPAAGVLRGAAVGGACGMFAAALVNLHCPSTPGLHVAVAHGLPIVIAAWVGAIFGRLLGRA